MGGKGFEAPKLPIRDAEGVDGVANGEGVFPSQPTRGCGGAWGSVVSSLSGVRGSAPAENGFQCFPSVTECLS